MAERPEDDSEYTKARERVETEVPKRIDSWGALLELTRKEARFDQFKVDVTEALHACMRAHIAEGHRQYERFSDLRKDFIALAGEAVAAMTKLRSVEKILKRLPPMQHDPAFRLVHDPWATACELDGLAKAARRHADECKSADLGGPYRTMRAFEALGERLTCGYIRATKRKGTGGNVRESSSRLRKLVEAVLPTAQELAIAATNNPMKIPANGSLGDRLNEIAKRLAQPPKN
jgi:hypothetical protein